MFLIFVNGIYDIISSVLLVLHKPNFHIQMYSNEKIKRNKTRQRLLGYWIFTYGTMRCLSYYQNNKELANLSYLIEAFLFLFEYYKNKRNMYLYKIIYVFICCNLFLL